MGIAAQPVLNTSDDTVTDNGIVAVLSNEAQREAEHEDSVTFCYARPLFGGRGVTVREVQVVCPAPPRKGAFWWKRQHSYVGSLVTEPLSARPRGILNRDEVRAATDAIDAYVGYGPRRLRACL